MNKSEAKKVAKKVASAILLSNPIGEMLEEQGYSYNDAQKIISEYTEIALKLSKVDRK